MHDQDRLHFGALMRRQFFGSWDVFEYQKAETVFKNFNDFSALFPGREDELRARLDRLQATLNEILKSPRGSDDQSRGTLTDWCVVAQGAQLRD